MRSARLAALLRLLFFVLVNRNRLEILGLENLPTIQASHVLDAISTVNKLGSLVLTSLHSEITPILDRETFLSSTARPIFQREYRLRACTIRVYFSILA